MGRMTIRHGRRGLGIPLVLALLLAFCLPPPAAAPAAELSASITVVIDDNYPPYIFLSDDGKPQGILPDQWRAWEAATGVRVELLPMDWGEALTRMRQGRADVIDTAFKTPERAAYMDFTEPYAHIEVPVFVHKSLGGIDGPSTLRGFRVGVKAGDAVIEELKRHGVGDLQEYPGYRDVIAAAKAGDIRVFSMDLPPAMYYLYKNNLEGEFRKAFQLGGGDFRRGVRKGDQALLRLVEQGFAAIPPDTYAAIEQRWMGAPLVSQKQMSRALVVLGVVGALLLLMGAFNLALRRRVRIKTAELDAALGLLRESEERFRTIFDAVSDAIFIHSWPDGRILNVNQRACELYGYAQEALIAMSVADLSAGEPFDQEHAQELMRLAHSGEPQMAEWLARDKTGRTFWVEASIRRATILGEERILVSCRDISGRKAAEETLARERRFTDAVMDSVPGLLYLYDDEGRLLRWNKMHEDLTGYNAEELSRMRILDWYRGDQATTDCIVAALERVRNSGSAVAEAEIQTKSGARIPFYLTAVRMELDGKFYFTGVGLDISERRAAESALADAEARYRGLFENAVEGIFQTSLDGRIIAVNPALARHYGYDSPEQFMAELTTTTGLYVNPGDRNRWLAELIDHGQVVGFEMELRRRDGSTVWSSSSARLVRDAEGKPLHISGTVLDVDDRRRAQQQLAAKEALLQAMLRNLPFDFWARDREQRIILQSIESVRVWGELAQPTASTIRVNQRHMGKWGEVNLRALSGEVVSGEVSYILPESGEERLFHAIVAPILSAGESLGIMGVNIDITERERVKAELVQSKQAADAANSAKSEFLANMSHEIRTPLNGILGMIELLKNSTLDTAQEDYVDRADEAARRLLALLNDILDFSRIEAGRMVLARNPFGLAEVFRTVTNVLDTGARKKGLTLTLDIDASVPPVLLGDDARLRQVLFNLVGNSVKFTQAGGVRVEAWRVPWPARPQTVRLCILVSDTGVGIAPDKVRLVFERFTQSDASHSRQHEGAGLGLAIVKRIVALMGGSIFVDSEEGVGTDIYLTVDLDATSITAPHPQERVISLGDLPPQRILIAEDEPIGQMALRVQLQRSGHSVTATGNGKEALEALAKNVYDCVLMDIQMPVLDGVAATRRIRTWPEFKEQRDIPVIALTAYVMEGDRERFLAAGMNGHVGKPVQPEVLARTLAEVVLGRPGAAKR
jgi:PAS domain S-box-containing protein